jgi:hypothetical protein
MSTSQQQQPASVFAIANQQQAVAQQPAEQKESFRLPDPTTLQNVTKFAISEDKPVMLDYWTASIEKKALIGVRENNEKLLVKSDEEYTSPIQKIFKAGNDFIIMTENSIYIVDNKIPTKRIS